MRKLRLLCLFCVFGVLVFCGNAFAADPAILASLQTKHAVVQVDNATLADAKGANYQIRRGCGIGAVTLVALGHALTTVPRKH